MNPDLARVAAWRARIQDERAGLIQDYLERPQAPRLLKGLCRLADEVLAEIWAAHDLPARATLIAVGGYGRGELYPQSDVDLLLLLDDGLTQEDQARLEPLVALFWDVGLPIGHSVRTLAECTAEAAKDITVQTNLLEARFLAGSRGLFQRMVRDQRTLLDPAAFFQAKLLEQRVRHGRHADVAMVLEPNLKESPGGLRDLHTLLWVSQAAGLGNRLPDLVKAGLLSAREVRSLATQLIFLSHLRIRLHLAAKRREDRMLFEFQEPVAAAMGVVPRPPRRASERLMQRYYRAARHIRLINELGLAELRGRLLPPEPARPLAHASPFRIEGQSLDAEDNLLDAQPGLLLEAFLVFAREKDLQGFTPRLLRALWRGGRHIDAAFRRDPANQKRFLDLLASPRGVTHALRLMHRLGLLGRYIPLFGRITGQMQHDHFHIYPVDEHTLMVVRNLRRLALNEYAHEFPLAHRLMADCKRQELLMLAALFHDIAKGRGGDHSSLGAVDARRFCRSQGLSREDTEFVAWLVAEHLTLSQTAQKQDLSDPDVITAFALRCGDVRRLTALYLLTVADIRGTSPKVWNAWKDKLTQELYLAARRVLEKGEAQPDSVEEKKEAARAQLRLYGFMPGAEEALWKRLDDVYFMRQDSRDIAWQTRRLLPLVAKEQHIVRARLAEVGEGVEVMVFAPDVKALFARICAFFARMGYSILSARVHTTRDGHALDTFYALDPEQRRIAYRDILSYIEHELQQELAHPKEGEVLPNGRLPRQLKAFPLSPSLNLVRSEQGRSYLLSFTAGDRPGLLARVAQVLLEHDASVASARINTLGNRAEDVFVLQGEDLGDPVKRLALEKALLEVLSLS
ncbi:MAG: [protein-PII] uridylyltransferase [Thiobacillus sp.]|nr:[protein-PII] uridylyltransferase [Thiobacillus sp.]